MLTLLERGLIILTELKDEEKFPIANLQKRFVKAKDGIKSFFVTFRHRRKTRLSH